MTVGFHCSHEQHPPSTLLALARRAEAAGFRDAMCSDHFHPWSARDAQSGYTWSFLGAVLQATSLTFGTVCAPGYRYHPAIIAQALGTLAEMFGDRVWVSLGSGEALNEAITGDPWPSKPERTERLRESVEMMRALWTGTMITRDGRVRVKEARLYTPPPQPPLIYGAALTPETARSVASWAHGLITVAGPRESMRKIIDAFREGGGEGKPMMLQIALAYARSDDEARRAAVREWPHCALPPRQLAELPTPEAFDDACREVRAEDVLARVRASADIERHRAWIEEDLSMGFSRVYVHNVVKSEQERFIDACAERVLPVVGGRW